MHPTRHHLHKTFAEQMQEKTLIFEAEDVNDPKWDVVINVLREHLPGFEVRYADGNYMNFVIPEENAPV